MYVLYIGNKNYSSWSLRPWVLMRSLEIPFEERLVPFQDGSSYQLFRGFSPTGKVPCLIDQDIVVWDSLGIAEYLADRHPAVWPVDVKAKAWARCASAEIHSGFNTLRDHCSMSCGIRVKLDAMPAALNRDIARLVELWQDGLDKFGGPFLAGDVFTAVDAFFAPVAFRAQTYGLELGPEGDAYVARLLNLPAMQDWYRAGLAETFRDNGHEAEVKRAGTWLADLRAV